MNLDAAALQLAHDLAKARAHLRDARPPVYVWAAALAGWQQQQANLRHAVAAMERRAGDLLLAAAGLPSAPPAASADADSRHENQLRPQN